MGGSKLFIEIIDKAFNNAINERESVVNSLHKHWQYFVEGNLPGELFDFKFDVTKMKLWASNNLPVDSILCSSLWKCKLNLNGNVNNIQSLEGAFLSWESSDITLEGSVDIKAREGKYKSIVNSIFPEEAVIEAWRDGGNVVSVNVDANTHNFFVEDICETFALKHLICKERGHQLHDVVEGRSL